MTTPYTVHNGLRNVAVARKLALTEDDLDALSVGVYVAITTAPVAFSLTAKQGKLLRYLARCQGAGRPSPTYDLIALTMGLKSKGNVHRLVHQLIQLGYVQKTPRPNHALRVVQVPPGYPTP